jgi:hypothetical protein
LDFFAAALDWRGAPAENLIRLGEGDVESAVVEVGHARRRGRASPIGRARSSRSCGGHAAKSAKNGSTVEARLRPGAIAWLAMLADRSAAGTTAAPGITNER